MTRRTSRWPSAAPAPRRELGVPPLQLLEQPGVLDGDDGLVGERLQQRDLAIRERHPRAARDAERTDRYALTDEGDATAAPGSPQRSCWLSGYFARCSAAGENSWIVTPSSITVLLTEPRLNGCAGPDTNLRQASVRP